jgi:hypothetical protein
VHVCEGLVCACMRGVGVCMYARGWCVHVCEGLVCACMREVGVYVCEGIGVYVCEGLVCVCMRGVGVCMYAFHAIKYSYLDNSNNHTVRDESLSSSWFSFPCNSKRSDTCYNHRN